MNDQDLASRARIYNLTREIPNTKFLVLADGTTVKNAAELASILGQMDDRVFSFHASSLRNEFSDWIKRVFEDPDLAALMLEFEDKRHLQLIMYRYMAGHDEPRDPNQSGHSLPKALRGLV